jgi:acetyl esterase/lipase
MRTRRLLAVVLAALALVAAGCNLPDVDPQGSAPLRYRDAVFGSVRTTSGVTYRTATNLSGQSVTLKLDVYAPPASDPVAARPAVVWVHGGGFSGGERTSPEIWDQANTLARAGYVNFSISYRLEPGGCSAASPTSRCLDAIREAREDAQAAVRWVRAHADEYGVDTDRIAIAGTSAGAITALNVGYLTAEQPDAGVRAAIALSGANIGSPVTPGDAPALLLHGTTDSLVPYAWAVGTVDAAKAAGLQAFLTTWTGHGHVPYVEFRDQILRQTRNFLWWELDLADAAT